MTNSKYPLMIVLSGAQAAPNLLVARHFSPKQVYILHTDFRKSKLMAERLQMRLKDMQPQLFLIDAYAPGKITDQIAALLPESANTLVNITGGTKPMSIGALEVARQRGCQPIYVRSQRGQTGVDFYAFSEGGVPFVQERITISDTITLKDYLVSYFGNDYAFTGYGKGVGQPFEQAVYEALKPHVDEIEIGWNHESGSVDVDAVVRCNNQVGIIEVKTGGKARSSQGIKQLAVAGGQRFFGTYTKRFLVVDQDWSEIVNNRELAEAIGIVLVELPGFAKTGQLDDSEKGKLVSIVHEKLGKPIKAASLA